MNTTVNYIKHKDIAKVYSADDEFLGPVVVIELKDMQKYYTYTPFTTDTNGIYGSFLIMGVLQQPVPY